MSLKARTLLMTAYATGMRVSELWVALPGQLPDEPALPVNLSLRFCDEDDGLCLLRATR
jgi:hypothetical protein